MPGHGMDSQALAKHAEEFPRFLAPFAEPMGRSERREGAALYIEGLAAAGRAQVDRADGGTPGVDSQKLQQFVTDVRGRPKRLWRVIRREFPAAFGTVVGLDRR